MYESCLLAYACKKKRKVDVFALHRRRAPAPRTHAAYYAHFSYFPDRVIVCLGDILRDEGERLSKKNVLRESVYVHVGVEGRVGSCTCCAFL